MGARLAAYAAPDQPNCETARAVRTLPWLTSRSKHHADTDKKRRQTLSVISATTAYRHIRRRLAATSVVAPFLAGRFEACIRSCQLGESNEVTMLSGMNRLRDA